MTENEVLDEQLEDTAETNTDTGSENEVSEKAENETAEEAAEEVTEEEEKPDPRDEQIASLKDQLLRSVAEFDNYRKRTAKERLELAPEITAKNLLEFLPVLDNLERALQAECTDPNYKKGIEMIHESFLTALSNLGVEEIVSDGKPFDPTVHQAVQQVENDELESGTVSATFQKGYRMGDKILRFAMVAVVK